MDQQSADHKHQTEGVPGLRSQYPAVRQRVLVNVRKTGKPPGELSPPMLAPYPRHHLAGQDHQGCCTGTGRLPQHAPHAVSAPTAMAGPCTPHGRWSHSKECPVWRACLGAPPSKPPRAALQGRLQARP